MAEDNLVSRRIFVMGSLGGALVAGCGGGRNQATDPTHGRGAATFTIQWPEMDTRSRLIPTASKSITIQLAGPQPTERTVARPPAGTDQSTVTFSELDTGAYTATATAYPNADGTGVAQATGTVSLTVLFGKTVTASLTMDSTIDRLVVTPPKLTIRSCSTHTLTVSARDKNNSVVLLNENKLQWTLKDSTSGQLIPSGSSAVFKVTGGNQSEISVSELESGKSAGSPIEHYYPEHVWPSNRGGYKNQGRAKGGNLKGTVSEMKTGTGLFNCLMDANGTIYGYFNNFFTSNCESGDQKMKVSVPGVWYNMIQCITPLDVIAFNFYDRVETRSFNGDLVKSRSLISDLSGWMKSDRNGNLIVQSMNYINGGFYLLDKDLNTIWHYKMGNGNGGGNGEPAIDANGNIYLYSQGSELYCLRPDGTPKWTSPHGKSSFSPLLFDDGSILTQTTDFYATASLSEYIKLDTNGQIIWRTPAKASTGIPVALDNTGGFFASESHKTAVNSQYNTTLAYYDSNGVEKWRKILLSGQESSIAPLVGTDNRCYIMMPNNTVFCVEIDGTIRWELPIPVQGSMVRTPIISPENKMYVFLGDEKLYIIE